VTVAAKLGEFTAGKTGKVHFLRVNRRNLAKEKIVRKISSPSRIPAMSYLCKTGASGLGTWAKGSIAPVFASELHAVH